MASIFLRHFTKFAGTIGDAINKNVSKPRTRSMARNNTARSLVKERKQTHDLLNAGLEAPSRQIITSLDDNKRLSILTVKRGYPKAVSVLGEDK